MTWAGSLLVPEGEVAILPCQAGQAGQVGQGQAGELVKWNRQGEPLKVLSGHDMGNSEPYIMLLNKVTLFQKKRHHIVVKKVLNLNPRGHILVIW